MTPPGFSVLDSTEHLNQAVLPRREEVASDEGSSVSLRRVVEVRNPDVRWLVEGVTGSQGHDRAIRYLKPDHPCDYPADDRTRVPVNAGWLARGELDPRHLDAGDCRLGWEAGPQQGLAHDGRRLRGRHWFRSVRGLRKQFVGTGTGTGGRGVRVPQDRNDLRDQPQTFAQFDGLEVLAVHSVGVAGQL